MNVQLINPFVGAAFSVMEMVLGETPAKGSLGIQQDGVTNHEVNIVVGVTGAVQGSVVFGMSLTTALKIASAMTYQEQKMLDPLAKSALAELCNMISGNAMQNLADEGYVCDITPPSMIKGQNVEVTLCSLPALIVPLQVQHGSFTVTVGLAANESKAAA